MNTNSHSEIFEDSDLLIFLNSPGITAGEIRNISAAAAHPFFEPEQNLIVSRLLSSNLIMGWLPNQEENVRMILDGCYELHLSRLWARWLQANGGPLLDRTRPLFFDFGAYHGYHSLLVRRLAGPGQRIYSFEPNSRTRKALDFNRRISGEISICDIALSTVSRERYLIDRASGSYLSDDRQWPAEEIRCESLSNLVATYGIPYLVKIDIEGEEKALLSDDSFLKTLALILSSGGLIVMEWSASRYDDSALALLHLQNLEHLSRLSLTDGNGFVANSVSPHSLLTSTLHSHCDLILGL